MIQNICSIGWKVKISGARPAGFGDVGYNNLPQESLGLLSNQTLVS